MKCGFELQGFFQEPKTAYLKALLYSIKKKFTYNLLHSNHGYCNLICWPLNNWKGLEYPFQKGLSSPYSNTFQRPWVVSEGIHVNMSELEFPRATWKSGSLEIQFPRKSLLQNVGALEYHCSGFSRKPGLRNVRKM